MLKEFNKLSPEEVKKFKDFVFSPYFNKSNVIIKLFLYLNSKYPMISDNDLSVKAIGIYLSEEGKVNEVYTRKIISNFNNVFESFLAQEEIKKDEIGIKIKLLKALLNKRSEKKFLKNYQNTLNKNNMILKDDVFYKNEFELLELFMSLDFVSTNNENIDLFQQMEDTIDLFYVFVKIHYFNVMSGAEKYRVKKIFKMTFKQEILAFIENNKKTISESHPYLYLEYLALIMDESFKEEDENNFIEYFKSLEINSGNQILIKLYLFKLEFHYKYGIYRKYDSTYYAKLLNLYRWSFKNGYFHFFLCEGILFETIYFHIIGVALNEKDFKWASIFIEQTKDCLYPKNSEDMYNLGRAKLCFHIKKYDECFRYLHKVRLHNSFYYFQVKFLLAKLFFEKEDFKTCENLISGMTKYYKTNKKILPDMKDSTKTSLTIFKKLLKFADEKNYKNIDNLFLKNEIVNYDKLDMLNKSWFLEVLDNI